MSQRRAPSQTINLLGVDYGTVFIDTAMGVSEEGQTIYRALEERGLIPQPERAHVFSMYSPDSRKAIAIAIMPFSSQDLSMEAGFSISQGGHAQAVLVHMEEHVKLTAFETFAVEEGKLRVDQFTTEQLMQARSRKLAADAGKVKSAQPLVEVSPFQARSFANITYNSLLEDDISRSVHPEPEILALRANAPIVAEIGQFVLLRTSGSACCSCSCSCWGSSSCSCSNVG